MAWDDINNLWWLRPKQQPDNFTTSFVSGLHLGEQRRQFDALLPLKMQAAKNDALESVVRMAGQGFANQQRQVELTDTAAGQQEVAAYDQQYKTPEERLNNPPAFRTNFANRIAQERRLQDSQSSVGRAVAMNLAAKQHQITKMIDLDTKAMEVTGQSAIKEVDGKMAVDPVLFEQNRKALEAAKTQQPRTLNKEDLGGGKQAIWLDKGGGVQVVDTSGKPVSKDTPPATLLQIYRAHKSVADDLQKQIDAIQKSDTSAWGKGGSRATLLQKKEQAMAKANAALEAASGDEPSALPEPSSAAPKGGQPKAPLKWTPDGGLQRNQ